MWLANLGASLAEVDLDSGPNSDYNEGFCERVGPNFVETSAVGNIGPNLAKARANFGRIDQDGNKTKNELKCQRKETGRHRPLAVDGHTR